MMQYLSLPSLSSLDCLPEHFVLLGGVSVSATDTAEVYRCRYSPQGPHYVAAIFLSLVTVGVKRDSTENSGERCGLEDVRLGEYRLVLKLSLMGNLERLQSLRCKRWRGVG